MLPRGHSVFAGLTVATAVGAVDVGRTTTAVGIKVAAACVTVAGAAVAAKTNC